MGSNYSLVDVTKSDIRGAAKFRNFSVMHSSEPQGKFGQDQSKNNDKKTKSKSYDLKSYTWSDEYDPSQAVADFNYNPIQKMIITEFQPDFKFQWGKVINAVITGIMGMIPGSDKMMTVAGGAIGALNTQQVTQERYQQNPDMVFDIPMNFIKRLFTGSYLNAFEVPFFNETYLKADTTGNWSAGGAEAAIGEKIATIMKESMSINFPTTPTWQLADSGGRDSFSIEFYLINNSDTALFNNFAFLNSLISGAFWVQMDYVQKSPNVYDIEVPGRFHIYFAALGVEVSQIGKLRTNTAVSGKLSSYKSITPNTLWPDAYKITITVNDLCPNNFNNYIDYLVNGKDHNVTVGKHIDNLGVDYCDFVKTQASKVPEAVGKAAEDIPLVGGAIKSVGKTVGNKIQNSGICKSERKSK